MIAVFVVALVVMGGAYCENLPPDLHVTDSSKEIENLPPDLQETDSSKEINAPSESSSYPSIIIKH